MDWIPFENNWELETALKPMKVKYFQLFAKIRLRRLLIGNIPSDLLFQSVSTRGICWRRTAVFDQAIIVGLVVVKKIKVVWLRVINVGKNYKRL